MTLIDQLIDIHDKVSHEKFAETIKNLSSDDKRVVVCEIIEKLDELREQIEIIGKEHFEHYKGRL